MHSMALGRQDLVTAGVYSEGPSKELCEWCHYGCLFILEVSKAFDHIKHRKLLFQVENR